MHQAIKGIQEKNHNNNNDGIINANIVNIENVTNYQIYICDITSTRYDYRGRKCMVLTE